MQGPSEQPGVPLGNVIFSGQVKGRRCSIHNNRSDDDEDSIIITLGIWLHIPLLLIAAWITRGVGWQKAADDKKQDVPSSRTAAIAFKVRQNVMIQPIKMMMVMMIALPLVESNERTHHHFQV